MKIEMLVLLLFAVCVTGCREEREKTVVTRNADIPKLDVASISEGLGRDFDQRMVRIVNESENDERRIAAVRLLVERLLSVPMDGVSYAVQRRVMGRISDFIEVQLSHNCIRRNERMLRCEVRLALIEWHKLHLVRLKPNLENKRKIHAWPDYATAKKSGEWQNCYMACFLSYRSLVNRMEFWWFPKDSKEMESSEVARMRECIEKCLGRPIRKSTGARADWDWETEEFTAVRKGRLFRVE